MKAINKLLMPISAYYDPDSDEIVNAKPGSFVYLHEEGHRNQRDWLKKWAIWEQNLFFLTIGFLVIHEWTLAQIFFFSLCVYWIYIEVDAYVYAFRRAKKRA